MKLIRARFDTNKQKTKTNKNKKRIREATKFGFYVKVFGS